MSADLAGRVREFVDTEITPAEREHHRRLTEIRGRGGDAWQPLPVIDELKEKARARGLWNLFLPAGHEGEYAERYGTDGGKGLSNTDYAPVAEQMGRSFLAPLVFNCNAPDTGNMEVLLKYGTQEQRDQWLDPLLDGRIRSGFAMTEPEVASSDATNMAATAVVDGDEVVINGRKWWTSGAGHPDCKLFIFMGRTENPDADRHHQHTMVLVPRDTPGVRVERLLPAMGRYDEPIGHGEVVFDDVRVPRANILLGEGRAFEIAQGRLGPGRVHHCMRLIGLAEMALELACVRGQERTAFGKPLNNLGGNRERIARARIAIDSTRLLVLNAAWKLDTEGAFGAISEVSQIKVAAPNMAQEVIDFAMQLHGGAGMSDDFPLAGAWTTARALRLADGPDEVHLGLVARLELGKYKAR
jgi:acyl-CoA dehydrogenase